MKESDWKVFRKIKENALEKFCSNVLDEINNITANESENPHNRYLHVYKYIHNKDKEMATIFDHNSRSKAAFQLILIRNNNLADKDLLSQLSEEFLSITNPDRL